MYQKTWEISARSGIPGEEIITVMSDGFKEAPNTVALGEDGIPDWAVTNTTGEEYIVKNSDFTKKYIKIPGTENRFKSLWNPITVEQINESISFIAPWGEVMNIVKGGYLVFKKDSNDIYGIQKAEFDKTYYKVELDL